MASPRPRHGLVLACLVGSGLAVLAAVLVSPWALCVVPFAVVIGISGWQGLSLRETWAAMEGGAEEDPGRGPAGLGF